MPPEPMQPSIPVQAPRAGYMAAMRWCPYWPNLLLLTMLIPTEISFQIGTLRLTPYRIVLLLAFVPALSKLFSGRAGRMLLADWLMVFHAFWCFVVIAYHHDMAMSLQTGGIRMLEFLGAYLIARTSILTEKDYRGVVAKLAFIACLIAPIAIFESVTGILVIKKLAILIGGNASPAGGASMDTRMGFHRAFGPFDHPILYGVFMASLLGMVWQQAVPKLGLPRPIKFPRLAVVFGAFASVSSGALAALMVQFSLLIWEYKTQLHKGRWKLLVLLILIAYVVVDLISNRSAMKVFLSYLTFSPGTAYNRIIIFEFGIQDVLRNPLFGIGFNTWTRPSWMHSTSMDNFWLVQAVTFGIPGFLSIALPVILLLSKNWDRMGERLGRLRIGWSFSVIGVVFSACTVHFWNAGFVYFAFLIGMGAWFQRINRINEKDAAYDSFK